MAGKILPDNLVEQLTRRGMTDTEIVRYLREREHITVTRQAISAWRKRRGEKMSPQPPQAIPWKLRPEHRTTEPARVIRWHARLERGEKLSEDEQYRYEKAVERLREHDAVLHYDGDTEQGWFMVPRRPGIDEGVIREPKPKAKSKGR